MSLARSMKRRLALLRNSARARFGAARKLEDVYAQVERMYQPGPEFEEFDPSIGAGKQAISNVIAFYLPQFHEIPQNNNNWGAGFTEWTNVARSIPRYAGHTQPRIPRDLGFYNLLDGDAQHRQAEMAKAAGVSGFCYYYYRLSGGPLLEKPLEKMCADPSVDMPFCLMWVNENWTRTWSGNGREVLLEQRYGDEEDIALVDDLARYFDDKRYIQVDGRPLLVIYRPDLLPNSEADVERIRSLFMTRHGVDPVLFMVQNNHGWDPRKHGLDAAIEFLPGKYKGRMSPIQKSLDLYDPHFNGTVLDYDEIMRLSMEDEAAHEEDFPLIRAVLPSWDNNPRRPGRGMLIHDSSPQKFEAWLRFIAEQSTRNKVFGESFVFVNAWNEWAEGTYLEPDRYYGSAYLNAVARAVFERNS
jgi:hypothetical protein